VERGCLNHFVNSHVLLFHVLAGLDEYHERGHRDSGHKINQIVAARTRAMRRHLRNDFSAA
jgi:hypothetical protein